MLLSASTKFINRNFLSNWSSVPGTVFFLRKARLFVKSRYSRNRQWSKTIVYFGLWFNIISVIWTIYYCYSYIFIFSHLYWVLVSVMLIASFSVFKPINAARAYKWASSLF